VTANNHPRGVANIFDSSPSNHPRGAGTANASNHPRGLANIINSSPSNHLHGVVIANANNHPCGAASVVDPSPNNHVNEVVTGATSNSTPSTIPWPRVQFRFEPNAPEAEQELSVVKTIAAATMKMFKLQGKPGTVIEERVLSHVADVAAVTVENIDEMSREAHARYVSFDYSLDTIRDMKAAGKLPGISEDMWLEGDERLRKSHGNLDATLKHYIDKRLASARRDGSREELLEKLFQEGYPSAETLVKLLYEGQHPIMKEDFIPNGHLHTQSKTTSASYKERGPIINSDTRKRYEDGHFAIFSKEALVKSDVYQHLQISRASHAPKENSEMGRTCFDGGYPRRARAGEYSLNEGWDKDRSDVEFPFQRPASVANLSERACFLAESNPTRFHSEGLSGGVIDVDQAYTQSAMDKECAKLHAFELEENGITLVIIFVVGAWGATRQGNVFCLISSAIAYLHNKNRNGNDDSTRSCEVYTDDFSIIDYSGEVYTTNNDGSLSKGPSMVALIDIAEYVIAKGVVKEKKTKIFPNQLKTIGYHFDFTQMVVQPLQKSLDKLFVHLFYNIKLGSKVVTFKALESLLGVMIWCSQCFLMARCFMCQLFRAKDKASKSPNYTTELSDLARSDLNFWRAIALVTSICPFFFGAPLKRMRENQQPDIYMRVDASGRGAGVFYSATPFDDAGYSTKELEDFEETSLRWTDEEVEMMERFAKGFGDDVYDLPDEPIADENKGKVPINTLEFFGIIFFVIFFAHLLKGKVVHCGTDSQSALSWCLKARVKGNWAADTLAKIFTLFCLAYGITITYSHVQGKMNHYADFRSRSESLDKVARNRDKALIVDTNTLGQRSRKWKMCRKLLMDVLTLGNQRKSLATLSALTTVASLCGIQEERR